MVDEAWPFYCAKNDRQAIEELLAGGHRAISHIEQRRDRQSGADREKTEVVLTTVRGRSEILAAALAAIDRGAA